MILNRNNDRNQWVIIPQEFCPVESQELSLAHFHFNTDPVIMRLHRPLSRISRQKETNRRRKPTYIRLTSCILFGRFWCWLPPCSFGARCGSAFEELRLGGAHPTAGQLRCIIISAGFPGRPKQRFRAIFWKSLKRQDSAIIS